MCSLLLLSGKYCQKWFVEYFSIKIPIFPFPVGVKFMLNTYKYAYRLWEEQSNAFYRLPFLGLPITS